ncbi:unnamed protein product [Timema podura]|uniref:Clathrin/coatomer adaptor adaptin-like N-terminal domain-containing protein n=1 Tax=Timema podura TaxID=61482 RepID=A0ABN7P1I3_TIMPD|nr:unnamed protein product [Timema podura]
MLMNPSPTLESKDRHNMSSTHPWFSLIEAVHIYKDLSCLVGPVVKLLPSHNEEVKKASYKVLPKICASHPEIAVLVVNTIKKDCNDPNPVVKCLAVSTLCSLLPLIEEHATHVLGVAIDDDNPNVRQTAVLCCVQVFKSMPLLLQEQGFIDRITFKRTPNLRNILVHPKLPSPATNYNNKQYQTKSSYLDNKPRWSICKIHQPSTSFISRLTQMEYLMKDYYYCSTEIL